jgi:hypothetical protein
LNDIFQVKSSLTRQKISREVLIFVLFRRRSKSSLLLQLLSIDAVESNLQRKLAYV